MLRREVDYNSGFECVLSVAEDSPLFQHFNKYGIYAPVIMRLGEGTTELTVLLDKATVSSKFTPSFLQVFVAEERHDSWYVRIPSQSSYLFSILDEFNKVPSAVMQHVYVEAGQLFIVLKFHHSVADQISDILMRGVANAQKITIESFMSPTGALSFLSDLHSKMPLCFVKYSVKAFFEDPLEKCLSIGDSIAEIEKKPGANYRALIYSPVPLSGQEEVITIDRESNVYETWGSNPLAQKIRRRSNDSVIYRAAHFARVVGDRLEVSVFLPTSQSVEFLEILSGITENDGSHSVTLLGFEAFSPGVMELV